MDPQLEAKVTGKGSFGAGTDWELKNMRKAAFSNLAMLSGENARQGYFRAILATLGFLATVGAEALLLMAKDLYRGFTFMLRPAKYVTQEYIGGDL